MAEICYFPTSENPVLFSAYLREILADITGDREAKLPDDVGIELTQTEPRVVDEARIAGQPRNDSFTRSRRSTETVSDAPDRPTADERPTDAPALLTRGTSA